MMNNKNTNADRARKAVVQMANAAHLIVNAFQDLMLAIIDTWVGPSSQWEASHSKDSVRDLTTNVRALTVFTDNNIHTIGQLCRMDIPTVASLRGCGKETLLEILQLREQCMRFMPEQEAFE